MINSEVEKIILSARDKFTVRECRECTYRKCCELGFGSADCLSRRVSISLMLGIEDSYFTKLLDDIEAAWKREKSEIEANALAVGGVVEAARHSPGNAAALRDAVVKALTLISVCDWPPGVSLDGVAEVIREIDSVLDKPPRNCDVGTPDEQYQRWVRFCEQRLHSCHNCECNSPVGCTFKFGDMPYEAEEGGAS